jgi:hypothetical protein
LDAIVKRYESLGEVAGGKWLASFNAQFEEVQALKGDFADQVAANNTNFEELMRQYTDQMLDFVRALTMEEEARASAESTVQAYADAFISGIPTVRSAVESLKHAVDSVLSGIAIPGITDGGDPFPLPTSEYPGRAVGTTNAPEAFIAGEAGPELIVGMQGATVFTATETRGIFSDRHPLYVDPPSTAFDFGPNVTSGSPHEKIVVLRLEGAGEIHVRGNVNDDAVWDVMSASLRPLLMGILQEEAFEEGHGHHDF